MDNSSTLPDEIPEVQSFLPLAIIVFNPKTVPEARKWLIQLLEKPRTENGADLVVKINTMKHSKESMLFIGANIDRILIQAEEMKMKKTYYDGTLRELVITELDRFLDTGDLDTFLTTAEKQSCILRVIENLAVEKQGHIPGYPDLKLRPGQRIITKCIKSGLVSNFFPLHDSETLEYLESKWYMTIRKSQPINEIYEYFGVKISLYFAFLGFYTISLVAPAMLGLWFHAFTTVNNIYRYFTFAIFNILWSTLFLESWKRHCNSLCYRWGVMGYSGDRYVRYDFHGQVGKNPVTGEAGLVYPKWKRVVNIYLVTIPIILLSLTVVVYTMLCYFWFRAWWLLHKPDNPILDPLPTIAYNVISNSILKPIFAKVAEILTVFENYRYQSTFDNQLTLKMILFEFFNTYMSLFYVAFYVQDRRLLSEMLGFSLLLRYNIVELIKEFLSFMLLFWRQSSLLLQFSSINAFYDSEDDEEEVEEENETNDVGNQEEKEEEDAEDIKETRSQSEEEDQSVRHRGRGVMAASTSAKQAESDVTATEMTDESRVIADAEQVDFKFKKQAAFEREMQVHPCSYYHILQLPTRKGFVEGLLSPLARTRYDQYLGLMNQFCYIYLFSPIIPYAPLWGLVSNYLEIRIEAYKLCRGYQRPFTENVSSIGIWQPMFEIISMVSVMTNCALLALDPKLQSFLPSKMTSVNILLLFVACEHIILAIKAAVAILIPKIPQKIRLQQAKEEYEALQVIKAQRMQQAELKQKILNQVYKRQSIAPPEFFGSRKGSMWG